MPDGDAALRGKAAVEDDQLEQTLTGDLETTPDPAVEINEVS